MTREGVEKLSQSQSMQSMVIRGVHYFYREAGQGTPLLLLHGFTLSHATWNAVVDNLSSHYRIIALDLLGHGQTDCPKDSTRWSMDETVQDIKQLMGTLVQSSFVLLGYSMGGRIALSFAATYPQMVKALILESASPGLKTSQERATRQQSDEDLALRIEEIGIPAFVREWEVTPLFASMRRLPVETLALQREIRQQQSAQGLAASLRGIGTGSQPSLWDSLAYLQLPVCLMSGALDVKFTAIAKEMKNLLPNAIHVVIADSGHTPHIEQLSRFLEIVGRFLDLHDELESEMG